MDTVMNLLFDKSFLAMLFVGILAFATVLTLGVPYLEGNGLQDRLKSVAARREKLSSAGYRGQAPLIAFMFFRFVMPFIVFVVVLFYLFVILHLSWSPVQK